MRHIDRDIHTLPDQLDRDGLAVVLIVKEQSELGSDRAQLERYECERNARLRIAIDVVDSLELHLSDELFERVCCVGFDLFSCCLVVQPRLLLGWCVTRKVVVLNSSGLIVFSLSSDWISDWLSGRSSTIVFIDLPLQLLLVDEWNSSAVAALHVYLGGKCALVLEPDLAQALLPEYDLTEVDLGLLGLRQIHKHLLAGAL